MHHQMPPTGERWQRIEDFLNSPIVPEPSDEEELPAWVQRLLGHRIGRYTVVRLLGHGGMGCVFEAVQEQPARPVALKVLRDRKSVV